jgi:dolichyl-phosphate beta-glucosyltransferase
MSETKLSVIIPAYNEQERLPKTLRAVDAYLKKQDYGYEIVVVSDGSIDNTVQAAERMKSEIKGLRVIDSQPNHGKGYAVRKGMLESRGEFRIFMDADNATAVNQVEKMWPYFDEGFSVIIGSRDVKGAVIEVSQSWWRQRLGDMFNIAVQTLSGLRGVWDTQCGFKGFSREAAKEIFSKAVIDGWVFDVEALVIAKTYGYKIKEIPVVWKNDVQSKVGFSPTIAWELLQVAMNNLLGKYKKRNG